MAKGVVIVYERGRHCIQGSEFDVQQVLRLKQEAGSHENLARIYPQLTPELVNACMHYALQNIQ